MVLEPMRSGAHEISGPKAGAVLEALRSGAHEISGPNAQGVPRSEYRGGDSGSLPGNVSPDFIIGGRYIIEDRLGEGGMGRIFKVRHRDLGKLFALKIIHQDLAKMPHI